MIYAIILAGGVGKRAGGPLPKQFQNIAGKPMLFWSVRAFFDAVPQAEIYIVCHPDYFKECNDVINMLKTDGYEEPIRIVEGGCTRIGSVRNALESIGNLGTELSKNSRVLIHDGARPLVSKNIIEGVLHSVKYGVGVVPVVPLSDSIRKIVGDETETVDRKDYLAVQTPQGFIFDEILMAYRKVRDEEAFTDDASVAEAAGLEIIVSWGEPENLKVTNPDDFCVAEVILTRKLLSL